MEGSDEPNDTQDSFPNSNDSNVSNLSLLADESPADDLGRKILEHARLKKDPTRWTKRTALHGGPVRMQAFAKARAGADLRSWMGDYDAKMEILAGEDEAYAKPSDKPTPPSNLPRDWGRKGTQKNDFLRRLTGADTAAIARGSDGEAETETDSPLSETGPNNGTPTTKLTPSKPSPRSGLLQVSESESNQRRVPAWAVVDNTLRDQHNNESAAHDPPESKAVLGTRLRRNDRELTRISRRTCLGIGAADAAIGTEHRPSQKRETQGSRQLLKQLSRASSSTPSPRLTSTNILGVADRYESQRSRRGHGSGETDQPIRTASGVAQPRHCLPTPSEANKLNTSHSALNSTQHGNSKRAPQAKSALEAILRSEDNHDMFNDPLGESTILSLKDLVAQDETGDLSALLKLDKDTLQLVKSVAVPVRNGPELRGEEKEALQRMGEALKSAREGLRDASRGITRVEHQFERVEKEQATKKQNLKDRSQLCADCGNLANVTLSGLLSSAWSYFLTNFYSRPRGGRLRLTWLGLFTLIPMLWLVSEITLCEIYCHPIYARSMVGYGVDIYAPRVPYVTTTILFTRPLALIFGPLSKLVGWIVVPTFRLLVSAFTNDGAREASDRYGKSGYSATPY